MKKNLTQKVKIMVVTPYFPPLAGGVQNYVYHIAVGLQKAFNWEIIVVTSDAKSKTIRTEVRDGLKIYFLPVLFNFSNTPINPAWYSQIKTIVAKEKPLLINAHAPVPFMADMAAMASDKTPFILTYHTGTMRKGRFLIDMPILLYETLLLPFTLRKSKEIVCSSDFIKTTFLQSFAKKVVTINPGVDMVNKKNAKQEATQHVLFVGGLTLAESYKGLSYLLTAIASVKKLLPGISLAIAGEGNAVDMYKTIVKQYGITKNVTFLGRLQSEQLRAQYQKADVLVLPSSSESFGMVLIEAMAQSTPVIASNIGGIPGVVSNGKEGILVPAKDAQALEDAIIKILTNKQLAETMGKAGYEKVKANYLWEGQIKKTKDLFEKYFI